MGHHHREPLLPMRQLYLSVGGQPKEELMEARGRRKLSLSKETVRRLTLEPVADRDLGKAVGGATRTCLASLDPDCINLTVESICNPCITHTCH